MMLLFPNHRASSLFPRTLFGQVVISALTTYVLSPQTWPNALHS